MYYDEKLVTVGNLGMIMWLNRNQGDKNNIGLQNLDLLVTIFFKSYATLNAVFRSGRITWDIPRITNHQPYI